VGLLEVSVAAGEAGPVLTLSGELSKLLGKLAAAHGLVPGVHPGYRNLSAKEPE
jgi:hypothetical protein